MAHIKTKKSLLKKIVKSGKSLKVNSDGASPIVLDNGLGKTKLTPGDGGGSNLGTSKVF